jgi:hypothetical protein
MALKFRWPLNEYKQPRRLSLLATEEQNLAEREKWIEEDYQNLRLLCAHFGIADGPHQFTLLALELAKELVPCFQEKAKEGRPRKWDDFALGALAVELERLTGAGFTIDNAAQTLAKKEPWRSFLESWEIDSSSFGASPEDAIKTAYKNAKKNNWTDVMRDAFKKHEAFGTLEEWDAKFISTIERK